MPDNPSTTEPKGLSPTDKTKWNKFVDYVAANKMNGSPLLDQRNKQVGMKLLQSFNFSNPSDALDVNIIPKVQQELQNYRNDLVTKWKSGKANMEGVKTENDIMPNISPVDGWPGTKTLGHKFPVATLTIDNNGQKTVKDFGTDTQAYDNAIAQ